MATNKTLITFADKATANYQKDLGRAMVALEKSLISVVNGSQTAADLFDAQAILNSRPAMIKALETSGYNKAASDFVGNYPDIKGVVSDSFKSAGLPKPKFTKVDNKTLKQLSRVDLTGFKDLGEKAVDTLRVGLYKQALSSQPFSSLVDEVRKATVGVAKNGSQLAAHSYTHANTAILNFQGETLKMAGESLGFDDDESLWEVVGPDDERTRPICETALTEPVRTRAEWLELGYFGGTPGGYNCRHQLFPYIGGLETKAGKPKTPEAKAKDVKKEEKKAAKRKATAFVPAPNIKKAESFAVEQGLAKQANYSGLHLEAANEMNEAIFKTYQEFPALKGKIKFVGSLQERNKAWVAQHLEREFKYHRGRSINDHLTDEQLTKLVKRITRSTAPRVRGNVWAASHSGLGDLSGIAYNKKFFKPSAMEATKKDFVRDVTSGFHPNGTATTKALVDHELAHQIDDLLLIRERPLIRKAWEENSYQDIAGGLSRYANKNINEFVAEGWAEYKNSDNPRALAKLIGKEIERANK